MLRCMRELRLDSDERRLYTSNVLLWLPETRQLTRKCLGPTTPNPSIRNPPMPSSSPQLENYHGSWPSRLSCSYHKPNSSVSLLHHFTRYHESNILSCFSEISRFYSSGLSVSHSLYLFTFVAFRDKSRRLILPTLFSAPKAL